ncbi:ankyrin repeat and fibronectin type-III domain-containing 1-like [Brachionus plicatilis]|uniref:Ankyrin repeat and fibronectin type-III domain-containing 1-like n=1 Tax=Brachionus plicatilis TaxID=10195 RepID=A0A3M7SV33_BRAPC|nr:ankyrin repeat and fibronectin type-III domain-containing 1-like [Brachionus plicatilis]
MICTLEISGEDIENSRLITRELIEINQDITLLLICPSVEQTCTMQLSDESTRSLPSKIQNDFEYIHIPVQLFEAVHLGAYNLDFIRTYVKISIKLELELFASNQFYREAFSNDEIDQAKKILSLVSKYQRSLEDIWKESRWIINCINNARDKANQQAQTSIRFTHLKDFIEKVQEEKQSKSCCNCHFDYNNNLDKKNIYNHITQLPQLAKCNCDQKKDTLKNILTTIGFKTNSFNHIDSVQIDDEDISNVVMESLNDSFAENFGSVEDLTGKKCNLCEDCQKNCTNCQKDKSIDSLNSFTFYQNPFNKVFVNETSSKTINKLVSKLYISAPTTPSTPKNLSTEDLTGSKTSIDYKFLNPKLTQNSFTSSAGSVNSNQTTKEHLIESPLSTSSSSGYYSSKNDSNLPSPSNGNKTESWQSLGTSGKSNIKKLNVLVDFETGLKIDLNFECTINGKTTCKDLIYHMVKKINCFINSFNQINKGVDGEPLETGENLVTLVSGIDLRGSKMRGSNGKEINCIPTLDENANLYFLVICLGNNFSNEKILANNCVLSNIKEPWLNGVIYLRNKDDSKNLSKKNLQQF